MNVEEIEINQLFNDPANVRRHSARNVEAVKASLRRFGQQIPLVVDANNIVRVGNARLEAMRQLGWTVAKVIRTDLAGSDLVAYAIADNRTGDSEIGSTFDTAALAEVLSALQNEDEQLADAAGYSPDELAALFGSEPEPESLVAPEEFAEFDENVETEHQCPKCHFRWSGSSAPGGAQ
ncbi:MAG TPA: ParB N-terminal domain-containing protein [Tepidisphaeraceae bacterium]|nr:ParB N-terminal domain-containing protein [Tepidisphaeraceae bacterium]